MISDYPPHTLSTADLKAIGAGVPSRRIIRLLRAVTLSKNLILLEAVRRAGHHDPELITAWHGLVLEQTRHPRRISRLLGSPRTGAWAADALAAIEAGRAVDVSYLVALRDKSRWGYHITATVPGLTLRVDLDPTEPLRSHFGLPVADAPDLDRWHAAIGTAWRILVSRHYRTAAALASFPLVLVPLAASTSVRSFSATSGWACGAIALTPPSDAVDLAETLTHELQHLILGATEDTVPLLRSGRSSLFYAAWRKDLRPAGALLQGAFAHAAVAGFWREEWLSGPKRNRHDAAMTFARWRHATVDALNRLIDSEALTAPGRELAEATRRRAAAWLAEPLPPRALRAAELHLARHRTISSSSVRRPE